MNCAGINHADDAEPHRIGSNAGSPRIQCDALSDLDDGWSKYLRVNVPSYLLSMTSTAYPNIGERLGRKRGVYLCRQTSRLLFSRARLKPSESAQPHSQVMKWLPITLALAAPSWAYIRFGCATLSVQRLDPVVEPGSIPSAHIHQASLALQHVQDDCS